VIWNRGATGTSIFETRISPAGKAAGTSTVTSGWNGNGGLALLVMPDKTLRLFASGTGGINSFAAPPTGGHWTRESASWGGPVAESAGLIGASLTKDGQPVTAWRGTAAVGSPPESIPPNGYEGGMSVSRLATDAATGAIVLEGETNSGQGGDYVQRILPSVGPRVVLPPLAKDWSGGIAGRIGAPGVYLADADGKTVRFYRYGGTSRTLATGAFWSATACAGPEGRLWVAWGDTTDGLFVTRTSRAAGALEPVQKLHAPAGPGLTFLQCEGSAGPVDLFADSGGFFHVHLLAQLSLSAHATKTKVTISARDAGDPVAGVTITVAGKHLTTDAHGLVSATLRPGSYTAGASAPGYAATSTPFTVR